MDRDNTGHRKRLKERFAGGGIGALSDYEIIEMLLFYAIPYKDCKPMAKEIIGKYKSLYNFINSDEEQLKSIAGLGEGTYVFILFLKEIIKKYYKEADTQRGVKFSSVEDVAKYLIIDMGAEKNEIFKVIFLNAQNEFICDEVLFSGTIDKSAVYPRNIIERVIKYGAKSIIFAHNHPSGHIIPSEADIMLTKRMGALLKEIEVNLLDHIIVGRSGFYSFKEEGII